MSAEERDYVRGLEKALEWFADPANWHEEELCEGYHFTAEWKLGLDPREIARRALAGAVNADVRRIADLVEALKQVRPYSRHIPARVLECIDAALAKEAQS